MKKNTHPEYQEMLFIDSATGIKFVCRTTAKSEKREMFNGKEFPTIYLSISSSSHPFFVGDKRSTGIDGRVEKFKKRYQTVQKPQPQPAVTEEKTSPSTTASKGSTSKKSAAKTKKG